MGFGRRLLTLLILSFYRLLSATWRFKHVDHPDGPTARGPRPRIYAHWHGDELLLVGAYRGRGMAVLSSQSRDGGMMAKFLTSLGYRVTRGSSSRGAVQGLKGLVDAVQSYDCEASLAVDGPRGPIYVVKPGILKLAQLTLGEVIPGAASARRKFVFKKAWNRCYLPLPFSKCVVVYGHPVRVPKDASETELEALRVHIENELKRLQMAADEQVNR